MTAPDPTATVYCTKCGSPMPVDGWFCPGCRAPVGTAPAAQAAPRQAGTIYCPKRDRAMPVGAETCPNCNCGQQESWQRWAIAIFAAGYFLFLPVIINALFIYLDFRAMERNLNLDHAHKELSAPLWIIGGILMPWVYLYRRASHTDKNYKPFRVSIAILQTIPLLFSIFVVFVKTPEGVNIASLIMAIVSFCLFLALFILYFLPRKKSPRQMTP
jgi:RNA polymerase subunit RPABC4/transcription elongation factor Spt4